MELHLPELFQEIKKIGTVKTVVLQIPEGLKQQTTEIAEAFQKEGLESITVMDPCYGACDLADDKAKLFGADLLVHFGHAKMLFSGQKVIYWPIEYEITREMLDNFQKKMNAFLSKKENSGIKKIGIYATIQFSNTLKLVQTELHKIGVEGIIGMGDLKDGQVLGCDVSAKKELEDKVDLNIYFGDGLFHALAIAFASKKPTYLFDPFTFELKGLEKEKELFLRQRSALIARAMDAKTFGIIVCSKKGQFRKASALKLKKLIESKGKKATLLLMDYVRPDYLIGVQADAFVNTACSRIATDDWKSYPKPMLTPIEVEIIMGEKTWEQYAFDEIKHYAGKVE